MGKQIGKVIFGAAAAAIVVFVVGFIFFATPLKGLHVKSLADPNAAALQQSLAANLPETGTYRIPSDNTQAQTVMYGQGPIATVHYNSGGFPTADTGAMIGGLVLDYVAMLLIGLALAAAGERIGDFGTRARIVILFALGASAYMHLGEPIWYHHDWGHFTYLFIADAAALIAGGLVLARWFLPRPAVVTP
ncbi:hypothetical protein [Allosphingosinicella indica]|uniref:Uncharacterized protein n=1 Tax=Allosphingosinicella indica TaxID=941907 RepID=A0A1X7GJN3_9SPHN|nr:hypothetical protein [Allosphingosinicella indica]SMF70116.1 hypothetical protein SAMN06295910_1810 [Allosphingosinicella indica]